MSLHNLPLFLSENAKADITDILQYTHETWGDLQRKEYKKILNDALVTIQENPNIGHGRDDLSPIHQVFTVGKHIIVYKISEDAIYISRILHSRADIPRHI